MTRAPDTSPAPEPGFLSAGDLLQRARRQQDHAIRDVANETKIQPWVLTALEEDRLHREMSPVYVRGFLTTYAKFLHLDPQELIRRVAWPEPDEEPEALPPPSPVVTVLRPLVALAWGRWKPALLWGMAVGVLVIVNPMRWLSKAAVLPGGQAKLASVTPIPERGGPPLDELSVVIAKALELEVTALRTTWIRVRADGKLVAQQRLQRGEQERYGAQQRFELVVAKPSNVNLVLNGQSITPLAIAHQGRLVITRLGVASLPSEDL